MATEIKVRKATTRAELHDLLMIVWKLYAQDPNWVPPLLFDIKRKFDRKHNPLFAHAEAEFFVAYQGSEPVGRITAHFDRHYDEHWGGSVGFFGWFESIDDPAVATALFEAAADWLRAKGRKQIQGPFNFNINDECGLLIDGFDTPPMMMMPHHLPYYRKLIEAQGFHKAMDVWAYRLDTTADPPEDIVRFAESIRARQDVRIRPWDFNNFDEEMDNWLEVYNSAWEKNWGAFKLSEKEFKAHALELRYLADPALCFAAENHNGDIMGMALTLPNFNEYFKKLDGRLWRLFPTLWVDMLVKKKYESCRVVTLGVKEQFRRSGVGAVFYLDTLLAAKRRGYKWGEMSWILETNDAMNRAIRHMGGQVYKTYRIFERDL